MKYDVAIIGAGLGGLECGYTLAKNGLGVCVLEQDPLLGGCLQTFKRRGQTFDTGFHYIGGLADGQHLNRLFHYFNLMDLPWRKMDEEYFDEVNLNGKSYAFANGYERFVDTLAAHFPHQRENLKRYTDTLREIGENIFLSLSPRTTEDFFQSKAFTQSAYNFLQETITDPTLRNVLAGTSLKMELHRNLPLYIFAQINDSFIQSAWRIDGGGMQIAEKLAASIRDMGGTVRTNAKVTGMTEANGNLTHLTLANGEVVEAQWFISNIHPAATLALAQECPSIKNIYKRRIRSLQNTFGMFTANLRLKSGTVPYLNRNQYIYTTDELWNFGTRRPCDPTDALLVSYQTPSQGEPTTQNIDLLTPMTWQEVEQWQGTTLMRRGSDYEQLKAQKAQECIQLAQRLIPEIDGNIEQCYTSTPLTYSHYTNTACGSAYGILKDHARLAQTMLTPKTPIPNLLLTGQNLNLHGILGVTMTSLFTCAEIIGMEAIRSRLNL